jgi:hypothetical protein
MRIKFISNELVIQPMQWYFFIYVVKHSILFIGYYFWLYWNISVLTYLFGWNLILFFHQQCWKSWRPMIQIRDPLKELSYVETVVAERSSELILIA